MRRTDFRELFGHGVYRQAALLNGKRRVVEESLLEPVEVLENSGVLGLVFDDELADFSSSGINGASIATMTKRNTVFIRARLTVVMVIDMKEKSNMAFRA